VDDLGWPWPKHGCFDKVHEPTRTFSSWAATASKLRRPKVGIITLAGTTRDFETEIELRLSDGSEARLTLPIKLVPSRLQGSLVIVSVDDKLLLHPDHAEIAIHSFTLIQTQTTGNQYVCHRCKAWVRADSGHEEFCRNNYHRIAKPTPTPGQQQTNLPQPRRDGRAKKSMAVQDVLRFEPEAEAPPSGNLPSRPTAPPTDKTPRPLKWPFPTVRQLQEAALESIAREAWLPDHLHLPPAERLAKAKQEALHRISRLSPTIKRQVLNSFTSTQWAPLISAHKGT
jgi:hypothetical protein